MEKSGNMFYDMLQVKKYETDEKFPYLKVIYRSEPIGKERIVLKLYTLNENFDFKNN